MSQQIYAEWKRIKQDMGKDYCVYYVITDFDGEVFCKFLKSMGVRAEVVDCIGQVKIDNPNVNKLLVDYAKAEPGTELFNTHTQVTTPAFIKSVTKDCAKLGIHFEMVNGVAIKVSGESTNGPVI